MLTTLLLFFGGGEVPERFQKTPSLFPANLTLPGNPELTQYSVHFFRDATYGAVTPRNVHKDAMRAASKAPRHSTRPYRGRDAMLDASSSVKRPGLQCV